MGVKEAYWISPFSSILSICLCFSHNVFSPNSRTSLAWGPSSRLARIFASNASSVSPDPLIKNKGSPWCPFCSSIFSSSMIWGCSCAREHNDLTLLYPIVSVCASSYIILLSPPSPKVQISIAFTKVLCPATIAPSSRRTGFPFPSRRIISVVVPPMSTIKVPLSSASAKAKKRAPHALAAGPDNTISTGCIFAQGAPTIVPSPLTMVIGTWIPVLLQTSSTDANSSMTMGIRPAFIIVVVARLIASKSVDNSCPQLIYRSGLNSCRISAARFSWQGFLTEKKLEMATASTLSGISAIFFLICSSFKDSFSSPRWLWPPPTKKRPSACSAPSATAFLTMVSL